MPNTSSSTVTVTYGILGIGLMGMEHIHNILCLDDTTITFIADNFPASNESCLTFLRKHHPDLVPKLQTFASAEALFRARICDIAVIATPNHTHHEVLLQALEYGDFMW